jgi:membrane associated rhomboid family serine protease
VAYCYRHADRETGLSCTECERPICTECLRMTPVGPRCPDHAYAAGGGTTAQRARRRLPRTAGAPYVTWALVAANVLVYLVTVAQGRGINNPGGEVFVKGLLFGPAVADGEWWRLITAAFLHGNLLHIGLNMLVLYWLGSSVEAYLGPARYLAVYLVSGLAGSAGALITTPNEPTVGASGAIFGVMGSLLMIEYLQTRQLAGPAATLIVVNLLFTFTIPGISIGGHLGGLAGGILATLALARFGRGRLDYGDAGLVEFGGVALIGLASVVVAYLSV